LGVTRRRLRPRRVGLSAIPLTLHSCALVPSALRLAQAFSHRRSGTPSAWLQSLTHAPCGRLSRLAGGLLLQKHGQSDMYFLKNTYRIVFSKKSVGSIHRIQEGVYLQFF